MTTHLWSRRLARPIAYSLLLLAFLAALVRITDCSLAIARKWAHPLIAELTLLLLFTTSITGYNLLLAVLSGVTFWKNSRELRQLEASQLEKGAGVGQAVGLKKVKIVSKTG